MHRSWLLMAALCATLLRPADALACACCAEPGAWFQRSSKVASSHLAELNRLRFASTARLYLTAAGADGVKGIGLPEASLSEPFTVALTREKRKWTFVFKDHKGERGALVFSVPEKMTSYGADTREGDGKSETSLYKEQRLEGHVWGNGFFKKGVTSDLKFRLVLQGRGNMCDDAEQLKHWRLEVWGPRAQYAFFGALEAPDAG